MTTLTDTLHPSHDDLQAFVLRMAQDGLCISRTFMLFDRRYALDQLRLAHTSADDALRALAMRLFTRFESQRPASFLAPRPALVAEPALER